MDEIKKYMERTGATEQDVWGGLAFYGRDKVLELVKEANEKEKKLVYYYASEEEQLADILSYKFE